MSRKIIMLDGYFIKNSNIQNYSTRHTNHDEYPSFKSDIQIWSCSYLKWYPETRKLPQCKNLLACQEFNGFMLQKFVIINCKVPICGPFYWHGLTLIPPWISNYMPRKVLNEITYPFLNFNGCTVEVYKWISNFIPHIMFGVITYPCWD